MHVTLHSDYLVIEKKGLKDYLTTIKDMKRGKENEEHKDFRVRLYC